MAKVGYIFVATEAQDYVNDGEWMWPMWKQQKDTRTNILPSKR